MSSSQSVARPFLKWAGGKTRLLGTLSALIPAQVSTYYEPFLGGGALFFHLAQQGRFKRAVLNDSNAELVNCYRVVRSSVDALIAQLGSLEVSESAFLSIRAQKPPSLTAVERAARFIYLNKTAFNGLYRVNRGGSFNVPWGRYEKPKVLDADNLRACSQVLEQFSVGLLEGDFAAGIWNPGLGDVIYFDPPYVPVSETSSFTGYTKDGFSLEDQQRVATCARRLADLGALALVSNSDTPTVREMYAGLEVHVVQMRRSINSKADRRGPVNELVVINRPAPVLDSSLSLGAQGTFGGEL